MAKKHFIRESEATSTNPRGLIEGDLVEVEWRRGLASTRVEDGLHRVVVQPSFVQYGTKPQLGLMHIDVENDPERLKAVRLGFASADTLYGIGSNLVRDIYEPEETEDTSADANGPETAAEDAEDEKITIENHVRVYLEREVGGRWLVSPIGCDYPMDGADEGDYTDYDDRDLPAEVLRDLDKRLLPTADHLLHLLADALGYTVARKD